MSGIDALAGLVARLGEPRCYPHPVDRVESIETHISVVLLAGDYAYKLKKPLALGFLDFSTLERRRFFCAEEVRLNRRCAPELYLDTVAITGPPEAPAIGGAGEPIEYAVRMRRFSQDALAARMAGRGALDAAGVDAIAAQVAAFHARVDRAGPDSPYGTPEAVLAPALENFQHLSRLLREGPSEALRRDLRALEEWTRAEHARIAPALAGRRAQGFVRECHGDLHLNNIAFVGGRPVLFDCIEFNPQLRWIDVASEVAFLMMDLVDRGLPGYAWRALDGYLGITGDYASMGVMRFYLVYRALVRAKVAAIRASELEGEARAGALADCAQYVALARRLARPDPAALVLMHGVSGSGKSTVALRLVERLGAVRVRSDVERKRLAGLEALARAGAAPGAGLYDPRATRRTYERLASLARGLIAAGERAVVDAAFLGRAQRAPFLALAREAGVPAVIAHCVAAEGVLRARVEARARSGRDPSDATLAVLDRQLATAEALDRGEAALAVGFDTGGDEAAVARACEALAARLQ